jgi:hypothetical protein
MGDEEEVRHNLETLFSYKNVLVTSYEIVTLS